jgi:hypothetical protein
VEKASIDVDSTPPVVTVVSASKLNTSSGLVIDVHDALSGLRSATLAVDGKHVQSLGSSGTEFIYVPNGGWLPGSHTWGVTATDNAGNVRTASGTFTTPTHEPPTNHLVCRGGFVPKGPERGAPMGIFAKHGMTCKQVHRSINRGTWHRKWPHLTFTTPGFHCHVLKIKKTFPQGEVFGCKALRRRFTFGWTT